MVNYEEHLASTHRMLFLTGELTGEVELQNMMLALDSLSHEPIKIVITSGGGYLDTSFFLYDIFRLIKSPLYTLGRFCCSAAVPLLATGTKRYLLPHARVMLHLPSGQFRGDSRDLAIQHQQMEHYKNTMVKLLQECGVKRTAEEILEDIDREMWLNPQEVIDYGLADAVIDADTLESWTS